MRKLFILALGALVLLSACSGPNIQRIATGASRTERVQVAATSAATDLTLRFGMADEFKLSGGAQSLVDGSVQYNADELKPTVKSDGNRVIIDQSHNSLVTFPKDVHNEWDLRLSNETPLDLTVEAGAYNGSFDLGGLRLRGLNISQGAADTSYDFSTPNAEPMQKLNFETGASTVVFNNLANANAEQIAFAGGAGDYSLDFGGTLARSADVQITGGAATYTIRVPAGTPARITFKGGLNTIHAVGFTQQGKRYVNASWNENQPHLDITVDLGMGTLNLESR
ncbi:MAG TPA: toast rack family protein [Roseiflexaceae bacterium]|nr:toast rack family protein [Roseiflexaceae bacterium]